MKKRIVGVVTSDAMDKTVVIALTEDKTHPIYKKGYKSTNKFQAHDEKNEAKVGDTVEIEESTPISKNKTWVMTKVISKAQG
jgi:small subunit ribosomal protein S17